MKQKKLLILNKKLLPFAVILIAIIVGIFALFKFLWSNNPSSAVTTVSESSLQKVINISELSTISYTYNAIAKAYDEDGTTLKYYVAYKGTIKAGIDLESVSLSVDSKNKKVIVKIPDVRILDYFVDSGDLDYIFEKEKYNTSTVSSEAYSLCLEDLKNKAGNEPKLLELARENAILAIKGLIEPSVKQIDATYMVEVN